MYYIFTHEQIAKDNHYKQTLTNVRHYIS